MQLRGVVLRKNRTDLFVVLSFVRSVLHAGQNGDCRSAFMLQNRCVTQHQNPRAQARGYRSGRGAQPSSGSARGDILSSVSFYSFFFFSFTSPTFLTFCLFFISFSCCFFLYIFFHRPLFYSEFLLSISVLHFVCLFLFIVFSFLCSVISFRLFFLIFSFILIPQLFSFFLPFPVHNNLYLSNTSLSTYVFIFFALVSFPGSVFFTFFSPCIFGELFLKCYE